MDSKRILFLSTVSPHDKRSWSGISYHIYSCISRHHTVSWHGPLTFSKIQGRLMWAFNRFNRLFNRKFTTHSLWYARFMGKRLQKKIPPGAFDCIVAGSGESELIAFLDTTVPVIYCADSTFKNMVNYYPWHTGLHKDAIRQGNIVEQKAIDRSAHIIYSSEWAARSAMEDYHASRLKISIQAFGANISILPEKEIILQKQISQECRILFIGVHWIRKGGDIAYAAYQLLREAGIHCSFTVIGCEPSLAADEKVTIIPFLDKNDNADGATLYDIMLNTDILLVPSRADCTPVVFSEAAAFGIPVITTDTGGITAVIKNGVNGYALSPQAEAQEYSDVIKNLWKNKNLYNGMSKASREEYDNRLNWDQWTKTFDAILQRLSEKEMIKDHAVTDNNIGTA